jgi:hypothetical protein
MWFRNYIKERVNVDIDGVDTTEGIIGEITDEATGLIDQAVTRDNILAIRGYGLKVEADDEHKDMVGVRFNGPNGSNYMVKAIAVNEPRLLKVIVPPPDLTAGYPDYLEVITLSPVRGGGTLLKELLTAQS